MNKTDVIIIGAGPVGLFAVHQLGIKGLKAVVIDNLDKVGGQCIELYPDKPIYDIPAVPECTGKELTDRLIEQIKPFETKFFLNERVEEVQSEKNNWIVKTNRKNQFIAPNIMIAGGVGSFEPRKLSLKDTEKFEGKSIFYAVKNKDDFKKKNISIFGGGDSALVRVGYAGGRGAKSILWSNGATTKRTYAQQGQTLTVTVTDATGCSLTASIAASVLAKNHRIANFD